MFELTLGIPGEGREVTCKCVVIYKDFPEDISHVSLVYTLVNMEAGDEFKRLFAHFASSTILLPNTMDKASKWVLEALIDVNEICKFNWASYVLQNLVGEIKEYLKGKSYIGGSMLFLIRDETMI